LSNRQREVQGAGVMECLVGVASLCAGEQVGEGTLSYSHKLPRRNGWSEFSVESLQIFVSH
jgi:hypothetical protein